MFADGEADYQKHPYGVLRCSWDFLLPEALSQARFKVVVLEGKTAVLQPLWKDALTAEKESLSQFAEHDFEHKSWSGCKPRSEQHLTQRLGVLLLSHRFGSGEVVGPVACIVHHQVVRRVDVVVE